MTFEFNSNRKMMSVIFRRGTEFIMYAKGAVSSMLPNIKMSSISDREKLNKEIKELEEKGHRVLIMAYKKFSAANLTDIKLMRRVKLEMSLSFLGLCSFE